MREPQRESLAGQTRLRTNRNGYVRLVIGKETVQVSVKTHMYAACTHVHPKLCFILIGDASTWYFISVILDILFSPSFVWSFFPACQCETFEFRTCSPYLLFMVVSLTLFTERGGGGRYREYEDRGMRHEEFQSGGRSSIIKGAFSNCSELVPPFLVKESRIRS